MAETHVENQKTTFSAPDIECDGCATAIRNALDKVEGVDGVAVDIDAKTVTVVHDSATAPTQKILAALDKAGYTATIGTV